jgi:hypothetical protein
MWRRKLLRWALVGGSLLSAHHLLAAETPDLPPQAEEPPQMRSQPQPSRLPGNLAPRPTAVLPDPQSFLDAQSASERRRLLDKQQRTFQLEVDGKYAKALKAYCDTGYGDERCSRPESAKPVTVVAPAPTAPQASAETLSAGARNTHLTVPSIELPSVMQISGFGDELSAILVFGSGRRLRVFAPGPAGPRSLLPDGEAVVSIRPGEVLIRPAGEGKPIPLLFQASTPNFAGSE